MMSPVKSPLASLSWRACLERQLLQRKPTPTFRPAPSFLHPEQTNQISSKMTNQEQW
jgi:hypothetical protein